ncbi:hypothetical protein FACS1894123_07530 [Bacteroidia bacterium]|nr:hypothetical protein FACS1894123_07530 [Bacteroidia bacterium]
MAQYHQNYTAWTFEDEDNSSLSFLNHLYGNTNQTMMIGNTSITYNAISTMNWKKAWQTELDDIEGLFNIPKDDTTHVWELNFENNYLEIHSSENFKIPNNCLLYPIEKFEESYYFFIQMPIHITCTDGDTLTINSLYNVDTGLPGDIALVYPTKEIAFFNKKEDAVWTQNISWYHRYYTVSATLPNGFAMDSLRIYTHDKKMGTSGSNFIGLNFLKRFNVFFDMKNKQIGLQPIKNFQRIVNPGIKRFYYTGKSNSEGNFIITKMADYPKNFYKTAGLREGDEIIAKNGYPLKTMTPQLNSEINESDTIVYDIIRNGKLLKIVVLNDKTEIQGD